MCVEQVCLGAGIIDQTMGGRREEGREKERKRGKEGERKGGMKKVREIGRKKGRRKEKRCQTERNEVEWVVVSTRISIRPAVQGLC